MKAPGRPSLDVPVLERLVQFGKVFRNLTAVDLAAQSLQADRIGKAMTKLGLYESRQVIVIGEVTTL